MRARGLQGRLFQAPTHKPRAVVPHIRPVRSQATSDTSNEGQTAKASKSKLAVAAKITAAKTLARKLAEERQATAAAAQLASEQAVDPQTAAELVRSAEVEVAEFAKEAAAADAAARDAVRADSGSELQRLKAENAALQELLMQLAADRAEAERKLKELKLQGPAAVSNGASFSALTSNSKSNSTGNSRPTSAGQLKSLLESATAQGLRIATAPSGPVAVGSTVKILYNLASGPLPHSSAAPVLKIGLNRWETITKYPMERASNLSDQGDWWSVEIPLPKLLFRADFVVEDGKSGAVDNNGGKDFALDLDDNSPTAEEVTATRLALLEEAEVAAQRQFTEEEERQYARLMSAAEGAAKEARLAYAAARREKLMQEARIVVEERRGAAAVLPTEASRPGMFVWADNPEAGSTSVLLYNKASGSLATAGSVILHIGYDNWWMKDKRVLPMRPVSDIEAKRYAKAIASCASTEKNPPEEWWCVEAPVWNTAAMVDFAFTNDARTVWDNDQGKDFHTLVKGAPSGKREIWGGK